MKKYIISILLLCASLLHAQDIRTLQGDFVQIRSQAMFAEPQESRGVFYFVADTLLRWEYTSPTSFGLIVNGKQIILLRDGKAVQSNNTHALQALTGMIMQTIKGIERNSNSDFDIVYEKQGNNTILVLTPKKRANRSAFTRMEIHLDANSQLAKQVIMKEKSGDTTTIVFGNLRLNQPVDLTLF